jgi:hypothetical protein
MPTRIDELMERIAGLEHELEAELNEVRAKWRYRIERDRVRFERDVRAAQRRFKKSIPRFLLESHLLSIATAPIIYAMIGPIALLDLAVTIYQAVCFRAYGVARVKRSAYVVFDRQHLAYLNGIEKLNCAYCSYANGVFAYAREIGGRTEQYWCPIRHAKRVRSPHPQYRHFVDYGDAEAYRSQLNGLRRELKHDPDRR